MMDDGDTSKAAGVDRCATKEEAKTTAKKRNNDEVIDSIGGVAARLVRLGLGYLTWRL